MNSTTFQGPTKCKQKYMDKISSKHLAQDTSTEDYVIIFISQVPTTVSGNLLL